MTTNPCNSYSFFGILEDAIPRTLKGKAKPRLPNDSIQKINDWIDRGTPRNQIDELLKACTQTVSVRPLKGLPDVELIDTLVAAAKKPPRRVLTSDNVKMIDETKAAIDFKKVNQVSWACSKAKRYPSGKVVTWISSEWQEDLGYIPNHTVPTRPAVFGEDRSHCSSCESKFSLLTWQNHCVNCGKAYCSGCLTSLVHPTYTKAVPFGKCCIKQVTNDREKEWSAPTDDKNIRAVITDKYLMILAAFNSQTGSSALLELAFELYKDGLHDKVFACLDLLEAPDDIKCQRWLNFAQKYAYDRKYTDALQCVDRIIAFGKIHTLQSMQMIKCEGFSDMMLCFMLYLKADPSWFSIDEVNNLIQESLAYESYRVTAFILKRHNFPIEEWVKIINTLPPENAALFIICMNDSLQCDWNTIQLNPEIDHLRWQYLESKFNLNIWLERIVLTHKKFKHYRRFEDICARRWSGDLLAHREKSIRHILAADNHTMEDVQVRMWSPIFPRDANGWDLQTVKPLNLIGQCYSEVIGFEFDKETEEIVFEMGKAKEGSGLFDNIDIFQILALKDFDGASFSLDLPNGKMPFHPLQEEVYSPSGIGGSDFLRTLSAADVLLKEITTNVEISAKAPFGLREADRFILQSLPEDMREEIIRLRENLWSKSPHKNFRFWIKAIQVDHHKLEKENEGKIAYILGHSKMAIYAHAMQRDPDTGELHDTKEDTDPNSPEAQLAKYLSDNYDKLSEYFPVWARLKRLVQIQVLSQLAQTMYAKEPSKESIKAVLDNLVETIPHYPRATEDNIDDIYDATVRQKVHWERRHLIPEEYEKANKEEIRRKQAAKDAADIKKLVNTLKKLYHVEGRYRLSNRLKSWMSPERDIDPLVELLTQSAKDYSDALNLRITHALKKANIGILNSSRPIDPGCTMMPTAFSFTDRRMIYGGVNTKVNSNQIPGPPPAQSSGGSNNGILRARYVEGTKFYPQLDEKGKQKVDKDGIKLPDLLRRYASSECVLVTGKEMKAIEVLKIKKMPLQGKNEGPITGVWASSIAPNANPSKNVGHYTVHDGFRHIHYADGNSICIGAITGKRVKYDPKDPHKCGRKS